MLVSIIHTAGGARPLPPAAATCAAAGARALLACSRALCAASACTARRSRTTSRPRGPISFRPLRQPCHTPAKASKATRDRSSRAQLPNLINKALAGSRR